MNCSSTARTASSSATAASASARSAWRRCSTKTSLPPPPRPTTRCGRPNLTCRARGAKNIIYLHMAGAPSTLDLFDYKPKLIELNGQACPDSYIRGQQFAFIKSGKPKLLGTPHKFAKYGQSGQEISEILPHLATVADELTIIRSLYTDQFNHALGSTAAISSTPIAAPRAGRGWKRLAVLRPGHREPQPAELRRPRLRHGGARRRRVAVGQRFLADRPSGYSAAVAGRSGAVFVEPGGYGRRQAPQVARCNQRAESDAARSRRRPGDLDAHFAVRIGLPDADERAGSDGREQGDRRRSTRHCTAPSPARSLFGNNCLLARRLVEERRCASCNSTTGAGTSHGESKGHRPALRPGRARYRVRSAGGGGYHQGFEAARPARLDAGDLGRRVRPDADERGAQRLEVARPRPPPARLYGLDGGRRRQGMLATRTARPTTWAITSSRAAFMSTTSRRRSCA